MNKKLIQEMVRKTLNERYTINKTFSLILENEEMSEQEKLDDAIQALANLEEQGMSNEEIEGSLDEGVQDFLKKYLMPGGDKDSDSEGTDLTGGNIVSKARSGIMSQVRGYVIKKMFGLIGFKGQLASALAVGFADLGINEIIGVFKGGSNCEKHGPAIVDSVIEGLTEYLTYDTEEGSIAFTFVKQTMGEYLRSSPLGEVLAEKICNADIKGSLSKLKSSISEE
jgi:hypothetical protein